MAPTWSAKNSARAGVTAPKTAKRAVTEESLALTLPMELSAGHATKEQVLTQLGQD